MFAVKSIHSRLQDKLLANSHIYCSYRYLTSDNRLSSICLVSHVFGVRWLHSRKKHVQTLLL